MRRIVHLLLPLLAACAPSGPDGVDDDTDPGDTDTSDTDTGDTEQDTEEDTDPGPSAPLWTEGFEAPVLSAFSSSPLGLEWEGRSSHVGVSSAVIARSDSNPVSGGQPTAFAGAQFLALTAYRAPNEAGTGFVRSRHEVITDVAPAMVAGTTYELTGAIAWVAGYETPSRGVVRLFEPSQKGDIEDGSWPASSSGAAVGLDGGLAANAWQAFSIQFTATPGNAGQPLRLGLAIESAASDIDAVLLVDDLELTEVVGAAAN